MLIGTRHLHSRLRRGIKVPAHLINVMDPRFGAVPDGVTDSTAAILAAVAYAKLEGLGGTEGATVYFPSGSYLISAPIVLPRTGNTPTGLVHLQGDNCITSMIGGT